MLLKTSLYIYQFFLTFEYKKIIYGKYIEIGYNAFDSKTYPILTDEIDKDLKVEIKNMQENMLYFILINLFFIVNMPIRIIGSYIFHIHKEKFLRFDIEDFVKLLFSMVCFIDVCFLFYLDQVKEPARTIVSNYIDFISILMTWFILIFTLNTTNSLGQLIKALQFSGYKVMFYTVILIPPFMFFVILGYILLDDLKAGLFKTPADSLWFLIEATFAQFSFLDYEGDHPILGPLFLLCFLVTIVILLLNVLIGVLTQTFEGAKRKGLVLFYQNLIGSVRKMEYDSEVKLCFP